MWRVCHAMKAHSTPAETYKAPGLPLKWLTRIATPILPAIQPTISLPDGSSNWGWLGFLSGLAVVGGWSCGLSAVGIDMFDTGMDSGDLCAARLAARRSKRFTLPGDLCLLSDIAFIIEPRPTGSVLNWISYHCEKKLPPLRTFGNTASLWQKNPHKTLLRDLPTSSHFSNTSHL